MFGQNFLRYVVFFVISDEENLARLIQVLLDLCTVGIHLASPANALP